jgi:hypothetical protein
MLSLELILNQTRSMNLKIHILPKDMNKNTFRIEKRSLVLTIPRISGATGNVGHT